MHFEENYFLNSKKIKTTKKKLQKKMLIYKLFFVYFIIISLISILSGFKFLFNKKNINKNKIFHQVTFTSTKTALNSKSIPANQNSFDPLVNFYSSFKKN